MARWCRIHPPMQETQDRPLIRGDPTCHKATKRVHHSCRVRVSRLRRPACPRARAPTETPLREPQGSQAQRPEQSPSRGEAPAQPKADKPTVTEADGRRGGGQTGGRADRRQTELPIQATWSEGVGQCPVVRRKEHCVQPGVPAQSTAQPRREPQRGETKEQPTKWLVLKVQHLQTRDVRGQGQTGPPLQGGRPPHGRPGKGLSLSQRTLSGIKPALVCKLDDD